MIRPDFSTRTFDVLRVLEVHDGDTFRFLLDTGFEDANFSWLRLKDYSCPELKVKDPATGKLVDNTEGLRARMATIALLHNHSASLFVVVHKVAPDEAAKAAEQYGVMTKALTRYVAEVWLDSDVSLGEQLVAQGLAQHGAFVG